MEDGKRSSGKHLSQEYYALKRQANYGELISNVTTNRTILFILFTTPRKLKFLSHSNSQRNLSKLDTVSV